MKFSITNAASSVHTGYGYVTSKIMRNILDTGHKLLVERNADVEFCFNLPKFFKFSDNQNSRKVGYMAWESTNLQDGWQDIINEKCDEIWVPSNFVKGVVEQYTDKEVYVFKHGVDSTFPAKRKEASGAMAEAMFCPPQIFTPFTSRICPATEPSTLPPLSEAISAITDPYFIPLSIADVTSLGAGLPGTAAVVTKTSVAVM